MLSSEDSEHRTFDRIYIPRQKPARMLHAFTEPATLTPIQQRSVDRGYRNWYPPPIYDQGAEGACVGFGATSVANSGDIRPKPLLTQGDAFELYDIARKFDEWPGEDYDGSSVNGGCLALRHKGLITKFEWATDQESAKLGLLTKGPGYGGFDWTAGMMIPDADGFIRATGPVRGGHSVAICSINVKKEFKLGMNRFRGFVKIPQSWGPSHGKRGFVYLPLDDLWVILDGIDYPGELAFLTEVKRVA